MLSLNTLRAKFGVLLSVIIGGALLAFILSLKTEMGFSGNDPEVGEVNGKEVTYTEFLAAYEDVKTQMGGDNFDYNQASQAIAMTWQSILTDRVLVPGFESLGLVVSPAERKAMLQGELASGVLSSVFADPRTGIYDMSALTNFLAQAEGNIEMQRVWNLIDKQARIERAMNKYNDLVSGGAYANALVLNKGIAAGNTYKGSFVACKYSTVADSLVTVTDREVKSYYKAHKSQYKQTPYRTINYVHFEVEPTEGDEKAVEAAAKTKTNLFAAVKDVKNFVREEAHATMGSTYVAANTLPTDEAKALRAGKVFGPELRNDDEWYASRVVETRNVPDSLELQHIVVSYMDTNLADSLYTAARQKGADFAALASQYSIAETAAEGGVIGKVAYSTLAPEFADALANAKKGSVVKVTFGNAIQIFKVLGTGAVTRHYRLAVLSLPVEASQETKRAVHKEASLFAVNAKGSVEKFEEAAKTGSVLPSIMNVNYDSRNVPGLANSLEVVRWANDAKVGDVSDLIKLDDSYVVAVVKAIDESEYKSLDKVSQQIKSTLLRQKKAAILKEKMQGATLEEVAANAGSKVESFADAKGSSYYVKGIGVEPRVLGAMASVAADATGAVLPLIEGNSGVYAVVVDEVAVDAAQTVELERVKAQAEAEAMASRRALWAVQDQANVVDNTVKFF